MVPHRSKQTTVPVAGALEAPRPFSVWYPLLIMKLNLLILVDCLDLIWKEGREGRERGWEERQGEEMMGM